MTDTRTATRTVLFVGAGTDESQAGHYPLHVVDTAIRPTIARFGGRLDGSFHGRIVASFPDAKAAIGAATELTETAAWALPGISIDTVVVDDRSDGLPSAAAVTAGARALRTAGAAIPLGGAGVGAIVLWQPGDVPIEVAAPGPREASPERVPQPAPPLADEASVAGAVDAVAPVEVADIIEADLEVDGVLVFADDEADLDTAIDALARFEGAGLDLPDGLQIFFHGDDAPECEGHTNRAFASHGGEVERIDMCEPHDFTLRHEIAHVWAHEHLDDETAQEFLAIRDLEDWKGNPEWALNGSEHAAHIIAWGLADRPFRMGEIPDANDFGELGEAFQALTGEQPLHARARGSFTVLDLVEDPADAPPSPEPAVDVTPIEAMTLDTDLSAAPSTGAALAFDDDLNIDIDDLDDDDGDDDPMTL